MRRRTRSSSRRTELERILSLDISSVAVGFGVFDRGKLSDYGRYRQRGEEHGERLHHFARWLYDMFKKLGPDEVVVEQPYPGHRRNTYGILMLYIGVILMVHFHVFGEELPSVNRVQPNLVKRSLKMPKGKDHEDRKRMMVVEINRLYGLNLKFKANDKTKRISEDDVADGIAVGRAWIDRNRPDGYEGK